MSNKRSAIGYVLNGIVWFVVIGVFLAIMALWQWDLFGFISEMFGRIGDMFLGIEPLREFFSR